MARGDSANATPYSVYDVARSGGSELGTRLTRRSSPSSPSAARGTRSDGWTPRTPLSGAAICL